MRKITLALVIALAMVFVSNTAVAQSDGFFNGWSNIDENRDASDNGFDMPGLPGLHGCENDQDAPLGSGLLILTALGVGYTVAKRRD